MLNSAQRAEIQSIASSSLDAAEDIWHQVGDRLKLAARSRAYIEKLAESVESQIPGYPIVEIGEPKVDNFIAIVADMRQCTKHLLCAISIKRANVSLLQRVFYETSALLPSLAKAISYENGNVTEYLGDGILGLFSVDDKDQSKAIYAANRAASNCIDAVQTIVNPMIESRYALPALHIGIGMAYSKAVVTLVGLSDYMQPKVFGECVFRATKLACGVDEVMIDTKLKFMWPKSKDGPLWFLPRKGRGDVDGYVIQRNDR